MTETRSGARRCANQSAVMIEIIEALEAWCPPTFTPEVFARTLLAWWTIEVAIQSTRRSTACSSSADGAVRPGAASIAMVRGSSPMAARATLDAPH